jgi:hypothetical protein
MSIGRATSEAIGQWPSTDTTEQVTMAGAFENELALLLAAGLLSASGGDAVARREAEPLITVPRARSATAAAMRFKYACAYLVRLTKLRRK